jgi:hypothetical protein
MVGFSPAPWMMQTQRTMRKKIEKVICLGQSHLDFAGK